MAIQWFPGHMNSTRRLIEERVKDIDVVIEVLDARIPGSSFNPLLQQLTGHKPRMKLLNKQDVADPVKTQLWLDWYNAQPGTRAIAMDAEEIAPARRLVDACRQLAPNRGGMAKPMRVLICGVPNVGKSTLINTMSGKKQAKAADEAGVTKDEQRIVLDHDFYLWDTPGMLWPRISIEQSGFNLAASGSIGRKRGCVMSGGRVNTQKAAEVVITDYRTHMLGRITLETPEEFEQWAAAAAIADAERAAKKEAIAAAKKKGVKRW